MTRLGLNPRCPAYKTKGAARPYQGGREIVRFWQRINHFCGLKEVFLFYNDLETTTKSDEIIS